MHVALEVTNAVNTNPTGIGRYALSLAEHLLQLDDAPRLTQLYRLSRWRRRHALLPGVRRRAWLGTPWPPLAGYDLIHATGQRLPHARRAALVATVHDVYAMVGINYSSAEEIAQQRAVYEDLAARADALIFVSENTRRDFLAHFRFDPAATAVVHHGISARFVPVDAAATARARQRFAGGAPYLLFQGLLAPNKNLARLLPAFMRSTAARTHRLVLVGHCNERVRARLQNLLAEHAAQAQVVLAGYVDDADIPLLYAGAEALTFPSLYEGFGLPILEAMAAGTPVLTSHGGSCPEVAGGHAVLADATSVDALTQGIEAVLAMPAAQREAARAYAAAKTWHVTAQQTLAVYRRALLQRTR